MADMEGDMDAAGLEITVAPIVYAVTGLPLDDPDVHLWTITVEYCRGHRRPGRWAVRHAGRCLSRDGAWRHDGGGDDGWLDDHRYDDLGDALWRARQALPGLEVGGMTTADRLARLDRLGHNPTAGG